MSLQGSQIYPDAWALMEFSQGHTCLSLGTYLGHSHFYQGDGLGPWERAHPGMELKLSHLLAMGLGTLWGYVN